LVLCLGLGSLAYAQDISFGLKGGLNLPNATGKDAGNTETNRGFAAGIYSTISLMPAVAIQPEVYFCQKGFKEIGSYYIATARIDYIEIPVLAKVSFGAIVKPYIVAGPYFAARLGASAEMTMGGQTEYYSIDDEVKDSDMGLVFGFGLKTPLKLSIEGRYSLGLTSFDASGYNMDIKNTNLQLLVSF